MHLQAHRLAAALNSMVGGDLDPGRAEAMLTGTGQVHHVADQIGALGLPRDSPITLRLALGRVAASAAADQVWQAVSVQPGRTAGLRGPATLIRLALEHGAAVIPTSGGAAWVPLVLGTNEEVRAVQWLVVAAEKPIATTVPLEAHQGLQQAMSSAEQGLRAAAATTAAPLATPSLELPPGYPASSHALLSTALRVGTAAQRALDAPAGASSFEVNTTEHLLTQLHHAAWDAVDSAVSWPQRAMVD